MSFLKWRSIPNFHNLVRDLNKKKKNRPGFVLPTYVFRAKVKLHGTNAGILIKRNGEIKAMSRSKFITPGEDNVGFAAWVEKTKDDWVNLHSHILKDYDKDSIIFGEWCGPGVNKGCAVHKIPEKHFAIFSQQFVEYKNNDMQIVNEWQDATTLSSILGFYLPNNAFIIPWLEGSEIKIDFNSKTSVKEAAEKMERMVQIVEERDPLIAMRFGIEGLGEGLVFYAINDSNILFKAKGLEHRVVGSERRVQPEAPRVDEINSLIDILVTTNRLEQGLVEACDGSVDMSNIGKFLQWMSQDVRKECQAEIEASGLDPKVVNKGVTNRAKQWFVNKMQE